MSLEKIISYGNAVLEPENELEVLENGSKIQLKPLKGLKFLAHFDDRTYHQAIFPFNGLGVLPEQPNTRISDEGKFARCLNSGGGNQELLFPVYSELSALFPLTVQFYLKLDIPLTPDLHKIVERINYDDLSSIPWSCGFYGGEVYWFFKKDGQEMVILTSGLELQTERWYHLLFTADSGLAKIFLDGAEIAGGEIFEELAEGDCPLTLRVPTPGGFLDELAISGYFQEENFTPPNEPIKPFSSNQPKAIISLDAGFSSAGWDLSSLEFIDEEVFDSGGIKLRIDADDDNTPSFSGDPLTLDAVRALADLQGKFLHLEFSFFSDSQTQRVLSSGKIGVKPNGHILLRRKPEILRRF